MTDTTIQDMIDVLIFIVPIACALRVVLLLFQFARQSETENASTKKRIKNAVYFAILAESAMVIQNLISGYYTK